MPTSESRCCIPVIEGTCDYPASEHSPYFDGPVCSVHALLDIPHRHFHETNPDAPIMAMHNRLLLIQEHVDRIVAFLDCAFGPEGVVVDGGQIVLARAAEDPWGEERLSRVFPEERHLSFRLAVAPHGIDNRRYWAEKDALVASLQRAARKTEEAPGIDR